MAEPHGNGILQVRAADLHDVVELRGFHLERTAQSIHCGEELPVDRLRGGDMDRRRNRIVTRLSTIHMVIRMRAGNLADYLIGIHIGGGAAAGLADIDDESRVVDAVDNFVRRVPNGGRHLR
jgi:hypothetical protein